MNLYSKQSKELVFVDKNGSERCIICTLSQARKILKEHAANGNTELTIYKY